MQDALLRLVRRASAATCRGGARATRTRSSSREVMLQQTQVARVVPRYEAWLERWPDERRAGRRAPRATSCAAWVGLGYNTRARARCSEACRVVARDGWPRTAAGLRALPGRRPVHRGRGRLVRLRRAGRGGRHERAPGRRAARAAATPRRSCCPPGAPHDWNQAMMELGATVCGARAPRCEACPVAAACALARARRGRRARARAGTRERFEDSDRWVRGRDRRRAGRGRRAAGRRSRPSALRARARRPRPRRARRRGARRRPAGLRRRPRAAPLRWRPMTRPRHRADGRATTRSSASRRWSRSSTRSADTVRQRVALLRAEIAHTRGSVHELHARAATPGEREVFDDSGGAAGRARGRHAEPTPLAEPPVGGDAPEGADDGARLVALDLVTRGTDRDEAAAAPGGRASPASTPRASTTRPPRRSALATADRAAGHGAAVQHAAAAGHELDRRAAAREAQPRAARRRAG